MTEEQQEQIRPFAIAKARAIFNLKRLSAMPEASALSYQIENGSFLADAVIEYRTACENYDRALALILSPQ